MRQTEVNRILYITIALTVAYMLILHYLEISPFSIEGYKTISSFFSVTIIGWGLYFYYGWKLPGLRAIIYKSNLNGTWMGTYFSKNIVSGEEYNGEIALVIRQTFLNLNVKSYTDKFLSYSFAETILHHRESRSNQLIYMYSQNQFDPVDEGVRRGSTELHLVCESKSDKLFGDFYTNVGSHGKLKVVHMSAEHFDSFVDIKHFAELKGPK
ncbi:MAG: hypothetical protein WAN11_21295 [Syntrophobacteraceae bacterium]